MFFRLFRSFGRSRATNSSNMCKDWSEIDPDECLAMEYMADLRYGQNRFNPYLYECEIDNRWINREFIPLNYE